MIIYNTYRKRFYLIQGIAWLLIVAEIFAIIFLLNSNYQFINNNDLVRAAVGALLGFSLVSTVSFSISLYSDYSSKLNQLKEEKVSKLEKAIREVELKYDLLFRELHKLQNEISIRLKNRRQLSEEMIKMFENQLVEVNERIHKLHFLKMNELEQGFKKYGSDQDRF